MLAQDGLIVRGGFRFGTGEDAPSGPEGLPADAVLLIGNRGGEMWPHFRSWQAEQPSNPVNPLDTWSRMVIGHVAAHFGARAVSPSDRPFLPFQQWGIRAERLKPSPMGILMHPRFGLWYAYRGALLLSPGLLADEVHVLNQAAADPIHLCDLCVGKPCLKACPVDAHSTSGFDYRACLAHVRSADGAPCRDTGCLDRNACPYGVEWRYPSDMQAFIMAAFAGL